MSDIKVATLKTDTITNQEGTFSTTTNLLSNMPAFSAHIGSGNPGLSAATWTKIAADTELFDTNNNYDTSNYRFTPSVGGYYKVLVAVKIYRASGQQNFIKATAIYKNGSKYKEIAIDGDFEYNNNNTHVTTSAIIHLNGSSDYIEAYAYSGVSGNIISGGSIGNTFEAFRLIGS